jgi:regulator of ribosome biosynthesis
MSDTEMADAHFPLSPSDQLKKEAAQAVQMQSETSSRLPVTVTKPIPYTFDLGHLMVNDTNPLDAPLTNDVILSTGRDCAQALINQLLTVCAIESATDGVYITLPAPITPLPREKHIPKDKEPTTWERFAAKKGIQAKKRDGKLVYDEDTGDWVPKYGFKGKNKKGENDWLVEVDEKKEQATGVAGNARTEKRAERVERVRRQERKERANERRGTKKDG